jgi:hypothetical protein
VDTNSSTTTSVDEQVSRLRFHLLASAAILRDRSRHLLCGSHAKRLRRLAALIEAATAGLCVLCGLPDSPSEPRDLDAIEASRNALCLACRQPRERHSTRGKCLTGTGKWSPISASLLIKEQPKEAAQA